KKKKGRKETILVNPNSEYLIEEGDIGYILCDSSQQKATVKGVEMGVVTPKPLKDKDEDPKKKKREKDEEFPLNSCYEDIITDGKYGYHSLPEPTTFDAITLYSVAELQKIESRYSQNGNNSDRKGKKKIKN